MANDHTWKKWKADWTLALNDNHDINRITAGNQFGQAKLVMKYKMIGQMINSLDEISNSVASRNNTIELLVFPNQNLTNVFEKLTSIIANLQV